MDIWQSTQLEQNIMPATEESYRAGKDTGWANGDYYLCWKTGDF